MRGRRKKKVVEEEVMEFLEEGEEERGLEKLLRGLSKKDKEKLYRGLADQVISKWKGVSKEERLKRRGEINEDLRRVFAEWRDELTTGDRKAIKKIVEDELGLRVRVDVREKMVEKKRERLARVKGLEITQAGEIEGISEEISEYISGDEKMWKRIEMMDEFVLALRKKIEEIGEGTGEKEIFSLSERLGKVEGIHLRSRRVGFRYIFPFLVDFEEEYWKAIRNADFDETLGKIYRKYFEYLNSLRDEKAREIMIRKFKGVVDIGEEIEGIKRLSLDKISEIYSPRYFYLIRDVGAENWFQGMKRFLEEGIGYLDEEEKEKARKVIEEFLAGRKVGKDIQVIARFGVGKIGAENVAIVPSFDLKGKDAVADLGGGRVVKKYKIKNWARNLLALMTDLTNEVGDTYVMIEGVLVSELAEGWREAILNSLKTEVSALGEEEVLRMGRMLDPFFKKLDFERMIAIMKNIDGTRDGLVAMDKFFNYALEGDWVSKLKDYVKKMAEVQVKNRDDFLAILKSISFIEKKEDEMIEGVVEMGREVNKEMKKEVERERKKMGEIREMVKEREKVVEEAIEGERVEAEVGEVVEERRKEIGRRLGRKEILERLKKAGKGRIALAGLLGVLGGIALWRLLRGVGEEEKEEFRIEFLEEGAGKEMRDIFVENPFASALGLLSAYLELLRGRMVEKGMELKQTVLTGGAIYSLLQANLPHLSSEDILSIELYSSLNDLTGSEKMKLYKGWYQARKMGISHITPEVAMSYSLVADNEAETRISEYLASLEKVIGEELKRLEREYYSIFSMYSSVLKSYHSFETAIIKMKLAEMFRGGEGGRLSRREERMRAVEALLGEK